MNTPEAAVVMAAVLLSIASMISFAYSRRSDTVRYYREYANAIDESDAANKDEAEDYMRLMSVIADFTHTDESGKDAE